MQTTTRHQPQTAAELTKEIQSVEWTLRTWYPAQFKDETHARRLATLRKNKAADEKRLSHLVTELGSAVQEERA